MENLENEINETAQVEATSSENTVSDTTEVTTKKAKKKERDSENTFLSSLHDVVFLVAGALLVFSLLFRVVVVSGGSMNDTLIDGDWLFLVGNVLYNDPKQGDIVVACKNSYDNGTPIIKRVIATEGQTVDITPEGIVTVDGKALEEPYALSATTPREGGLTFPLTVDKGCVFVLGDNRAWSKDSRSSEIGLIDCREILGKAIFIMFPGNNKGNTNRNFGRIGVVS